MVQCNSVTVQSADNPAATIVDYGFIKCNSSNFGTCAPTSIPTTCPTLVANDYYNVGIQYSISGINNPNTTNKIAVTFTTVVNGTTYSLTVNNVAYQNNSALYTLGMIIGTTYNPIAESSKTYAITSCTVSNLVVS